MRGPSAPPQKPSLIASEDPVPPSSQHSHDDGVADDDVRHERSGNGASMLSCETKYEEATKLGLSLIVHMILQKRQLLLDGGETPAGVNLSSVGAADVHFEAPLKIVMYPDPILRAKNKRVDTFDENLKKLVDEMFDLMYKTGGIGLAAPQVGINVQLMVFNTIGERGGGGEIVLVNPQVTSYSKRLCPFTEGCLSLPGIYGDVVRPEAVKIDAQDITGAKFSVSLSHLRARVFQHEFDHLEGILFFDRMTGEAVDSIRSQLLALEVGTKI